MPDSLETLRNDLTTFAFRMGQDAGEMRIEVATHDAQIADHTDRLIRLQDRMRIYGKSHSDDITALFGRLEALEASVRDYEVAEALEDLLRRTEALEARVALCGGIPEKARQVDYQILHLQEGEGPTLHAFVNWLLSDHYVTKQTPGDAKLITKEQLIGEYLVYRAGFGGE